MSTVVPVGAPRQWVPLSCSLIPCVEPGFIVVDVVVIVASYLVLLFSHARVIVILGFSSG